jgi:hypothetical protein
MAGIAGVIGGAGTENAAPFDQGDAHIARGLQQIDGGQQAAETRADDGDMRSILLRHAHPRFSFPSLSITRGDPEGSWR